MPAIVCMSSFTACKANIPYPLFMASVFSYFFVFVFSGIQNKPPPTEFNSVEINWIHNHKLFYNRRLAPYEHHEIW